MLDTARMVLVALFCVLALGCANKEEAKPSEAPKNAEPAKTPAQAEPAAEPVAADPVAPPTGLVPDLQKLSDKACACKDKACTSGIQDEVAKLMSGAKQPPAAEAQAIANIMQKLQGCVAATQKK